MIRTNVLQPCIKGSMPTTREVGHVTFMSDGCAAQRISRRGHSYVMRTSHFGGKGCSAATGACAGEVVYRNFFMDLCYSSFTEQGVQLRRIAVD
jgi:hypothetical protein